MNVPPASHPAWAAIVTGKQAFEPSFIAVRLFLVRARIDVTKAGSPPALIRKLAEELREIYGSNAASPSASRDLEKLFS